MSKGINKVIIVGNVGQDPEVRFTPGGDAVANLSLATNEQWLDKNSGQRQQRTEWHRIVLWRKAAEIAQQYVRKGMTLYVEGKLQTRKYQDQNGIDRYSTEIVARDMQMLGGSGQQPPPQQQGAAPSPYANNPRPPQGAPDPGAYDDFNDEIPFSQEGA